jgi:hypothetical protein
MPTFNCDWPPPVTAFRESLDLLRTRRFGTFCFASLLSNIGTWAQQVAEPWLLLSLGASSFVIGLDAFREWHGRTHTVTVTEDGFEYAGSSYASLTKIAKKITGAHWSGPRFFGLLVTGKERPSGGRNG